PKRQKKEPSNTASSATKGEPGNGAISATKGEPGNGAISATKGEPGNGAISATKGEPGNGPALCRRSQNYRLRLQEPDSELEALRGSRPPELPAGKRGGWLRDSVYPRFRLTSLPHGR